MAHAGHVDGRGRDSAGRPRLARLTGDRPRARPAGRPAGAAPRPGGASPGAPLRAAALALLRPVRRSRHPVARARQLPGGAGAGGGAAHVAHQHRSPASLHHERPRPRVHPARGHGAPAGAGAPLAGAHAAVPRPLLQLVRPARPDRAGAGVREHGGQRQSRRASHRAAPGVSRPDRRAGSDRRRPSGRSRRRWDWPTSGCRIRATSARADGSTRRPVRARDGESGGQRPALERAQAALRPDHPASSGSIGVCGP